jgi:hypothetical protein
LESWGRREGNLLLILVDIQQGAKHELKMVLFCVGKVVSLFFVGIEGASSNFVEQGLPDVGQVLVNQCDSGFLFPAKTFTQLCRKFQTTCATAYNHDMM